MKQLQDEAGAIARDGGGAESRNEFDVDSETTVSVR